MVNRIRALAPATTTATVRTTPTCSLTTQSDDPIPAADRYAHTAYQAASPRAATTRISLAVHHDQRRSSPATPIAQTDRTATGASIDHRISTTCQIDSRDAAAGTTTPGGSMSVAAGRVVAERPRFAPGSQTDTAGSAP